MNINRKVNKAMGINMKTGRVVDLKKMQEKLSIFTPTNYLT